MLPIYLSHWYIFLIITWVIMNKFKIYGHQFINVYYVSIILLIGFLLIYGYHIVINNIRYEFSLLFTKFIFHIMPLFILIKYYKLKNKYAIETLIIITLLYFLFIRSKNLTIYDIYDKENTINSWEQIIIKCQNKQNILPLCYIYKFLNEILKVLFSVLNIS